MNRYSYLVSNKLPMVERLFGGLFREGQVFLIDNDINPRYRRLEFIAGEWKLRDLDSNKILKSKMLNIENFTNGIYEPI